MVNKWFLMLVLELLYNLEIMAFFAFYAFAEQELHKHGIKKYYLEVLQQNNKAKALYERIGFSVVREFLVMQLTQPSEISNNINEFNFFDLKNLTLVKPSYEHSYNIIKQNQNLYKVAYIKDKITAFCVYNADNGSLIQLGYYNISDLKEVIKYIACKYKSIITKNIDMSYHSVVEMMLSIGFKEIVSQYEMVKDI